MSQHRASRLCSNMLPISFFLQGIILIAAAVLLPACSAIPTTALNTLPVILEIISGIAFALCGLIQTLCAVVSLLKNPAAMHIMFRGIIDITAGTVMLTRVHTSMTFLTGLSAVVLIEKAFTAYYLGFALKLSDLRTAPTADTAAVKNTIHDCETPDIAEFCRIFGRPAISPNISIDSSAKVTPPATVKSQTEHLCPCLSPCTILHILGTAVLICAALLVRSSICAHTNRFLLPLSFLITAAANFAAGYITHRR